jgi:hypothetical protein
VRASLLNSTTQHRYAFAAAPQKVLPYRQPKRWHADVPLQQPIVEETAIMLSMKGLLWYQIPMTLRPWRTTFFDSCQTKS